MSPELRCNNYQVIKLAHLFVLLFVLASCNRSSPEKYNIHVSLDKIQTKNTLRIHKGEIVFNEEGKIELYFAIVENLKPRKDGKILHQYSIQVDNTSTENPAEPFSSIKVDQLNQFENQLTVYKGNPVMLDEPTNKLSIWEGSWQKINVVDMKLKNIYSDNSKLYGTLVSDDAISFCLLEISIKENNSDLIVISEVVVTDVPQEDYKLINTQWMPIDAIDNYDIATWTTCYTSGSVPYYELFLLNFGDSYTGNSKRYTMLQGDYSSEDVSVPRIPSVDLGEEIALRRNRDYGPSDLILLPYSMKMYGDKFTIIGKNGLEQTMYSINWNDLCNSSDKSTLDFHTMSFEPPIRISENIFTFSDKYWQLSFVDENVEDPEHNYILLLKEIPGL